jgi:hypothetical protein
VKYLCTILAFLVLTLSVQPVCVAGTGNNTDCCTESSCAGNEEGDTDETGHGDCTNCNPFQLCGCCAFSIVPAVAAALRLEEGHTFLQYSWATLCCPFIEEPVLGFWQPPKIG